MREFRTGLRIERSLSAIEMDRRSGASELAQRALKVFHHAAPKKGISTERYVRAVRGLAVRLSESRPTMAPIEGVVARLVYDFASRARAVDDSEDAYALLEVCAAKLERELGGIARLIADHFASRFGHHRRPLLISYSSRVAAALAGPKTAGLHITVCESRPAFEGRRTARLLAESASSVTLITEAQIGIVMDDCDSVVLGCDAIHPDGSIVNKAGSYLLALAGKARKRPVIVVGDSYKLTAGGPGPLESHPETQVWKHAPKGIRVKNVGFENVPAPLVDYFVLEKGVCRRTKIRSHWRVVRRYRDFLQANRERKRRAAGRT